MSMKKSELDKHLGKRIGGQMKGAGIPGRFAQGAADMPDRRELRRQDAAAGLVPFACKLPSDLASLVRERGASHEGGINAWVAEALKKSLG